LCENIVRRNRIKQARAELCQNQAQLGLHSVTATNQNLNLKIANCLEFYGNTAEGIKTYASFDWG
jgi:hypothetical protein